MSEMELNTGMTGGMAEDTNSIDNRKDYLDSLADDYGVPRSNVYRLALMFGPDEDYDGLVCAVEEMAEQLYSYM